MTTIPIEGKEYIINGRTQTLDGREVVSLIEVPPKPAPLLPWAIVDVKNGSVDYTADTKPEIERFYKNYHTPSGFRIARIVEVPHEAKRVWVVMDRDGDPSTFRSKEPALEHMEWCRQHGTFRPYTLHEYIEVGELKV